MAPLLKIGDFVQVQPLAGNPPKPGEILAYQRDGQTVVHRLLAHYPGWLLTKGDRSACADPPVSPEGVIGKVVWVKRRDTLKPVAVTPTLPQRLRSRADRWRAQLGSAPHSYRWRRKLSISLRLCDLPIMLLLPTELRSLDFLEACQPWREEGSPFNPWIVEVSRQPLFMAPRMDGSPATAAHYQLEIQADARQLRMQGKQFAAYIQWRRKMGRLLLGRRDHSGSMQNALRVLLAYLLSESNGMLLHASGVVVNGEAYVFFGRSGSGKSTVAALSKSLGYQVLSDDLIALRKLPNGYFVYGLPFKGSHPEAVVSPGRYPLAGIFHLQKSDEVTLSPLQPGRAVGQLLSCLPFFHQDSHAMTRMLPLVSDLILGCGGYELSFRADASFWELL